MQHAAIQSLSKNGVYVPFSVSLPIGRDLSEEEVQNQTSVIKIREHVLTSVPFVFKPISKRHVDKYITSIGKKKATGLDDLSTKVLKKPYLCHLTRMINRMFEDSTFPKYMKNARVTPIYKKEEPLLKKILSACKCITHLVKEEEDQSGSIKNDLSERGLSGEDAQDRPRWRRLTRHIDPT